MLIKIEPRIIALADQFIDDNVDTRPLDEAHWWTKLGSVTENQERLIDYHFTLSESGGTNQGKTLVQYENNDLTLPGKNPSPQLSNLINASIKASTPCSQLQFFGEYLHAFEDTFSHRDKNNLPYDALKLKGGVGHGLKGSNPDYTYNEKGLLGWDMREQRTLEMEKETFNIIGARWGNIDKAKKWNSELINTLNLFNKTQENEDDGYNKYYPKTSIGQVIVERGIAARNGF